MLQAEVELLVKQIGSGKAANLLDVSERTLEKWRREGGGPKFVRISHKLVRYRICDLREFQESRLRENNIMAVAQ